MNRSEFQHLADVRITEAAALLAGNPPMPDGAYYLAGYAVECALKACIAKLIREHDWPDKKFVADSHTHDLTALVRLAGLVLQFDNDMATNAGLAANWGIVRVWSEKSRYETHSAAEARALVDAVSHPSDGALPWIKTRW